MEAAYRLRRVFFAAIALMILNVSNVDAANFRTQNFLIQAPDEQLAQAVGKAAEKYRAQLAEHWLGRQLPPWPRPCPIRVVAGQLAAQGVTTYSLQPVRDFQMEVVGTPQRILDSVLPHEITHTILATHFGRPLPRWADEGICTTVEHISERTKHEAKLREFLRSRRGIAMNQLFLLTEYPNDVLPMYAQGYSVCRFLIEQKGAPTFIRFLHDYMEQRSWTQNVQKYYGYKSLRDLQEYWLAWVAEGSGPVEKFAAADPNRSPVRQAGATSEDNSHIALASATLPNQPMRQTPQELNQASGAPAGTALAQVEPRTDLDRRDAGWYTRKREEAEGTLASGNEAQPRVAQNTISPIVPPSVRDSGRYSVSQPQPEQQMSRGVYRQPTVGDFQPGAAKGPIHVMVPGQTIRRFR
jgi:hypothetical protein